MHPYYFNPIEKDHNIGITPMLMEKGNEHIFERMAPV
jgi:hypothetical protein